MSNNNVPTHHQPENSVVHPPAPPSQDDHDLQEEDFQNMEEIERVSYLILIFSSSSNSHSRS